MAPQEMNWAARFGVSATFSSVMPPESSTVARPAM